jgi:predicted nucleic acid-binding protein
MKLLDANIFLYASGRDHPYKGPSIRLLAMVGDGLLEANTDVEVLQEILHLHQSRDQTTFGITLVEQALLSFPDALPVTPTSVSLALDVMHHHPQLEARDAIHAAVVFENKLEGIISTDRGLDVIDGLVRFDPKELAA